jgi:hypothetical protein
MNGTGFKFVRLERGSQTLELLPELYDGAYNITAIDLGHPEPREVSRLSPFLDGDEDTTELHGPRAVSIDLQIFDFDGKPANLWLRDLRRWMHPMYRSDLVFQPTGYDEPFKLTVRSANSNQDWNISRPSYLEMGTIWKAPSGLIESYNLRRVTIRPVAVEIGREYPLTFPRWYENIGPISGAIANNGGDARAKPVLRIYGPVTTPAIYNDSIDPFGKEMTRAFVFRNNFEILAGDFVEINLLTRKILLNGLETESLLHELNFNLSSWWTLSPGENHIRFLTDAHGGDAQVSIEWRCSHI